MFAEIWRSNDKDGTERLADIEALGFCSADHAGRYLLEGRLPPPDFSSATPRSRTWRDRLTDWSVLALLWIGVLAVIGSWTIVRWIMN